MTTRACGRPQAAHRRNGPSPQFRVLWRFRILGVKLTSPAPRISGHVPQPLNFQSLRDIVFTRWFSPITQALTFPKHFCFNTCESSTPPQTGGMHFCLLSSGTGAAICLTFASPPIRTAVGKEGLCIGLGEHASGPGEQVLAPCRVSRRTSARGGVYKGRSHHRSPAL